MEWNLFWTILLQVATAILVLALPVRFAVYTIAHALHRGRKNGSSGSENLL